MENEYQEKKEGSQQEEDASREGAPKEDTFKCLRDGWKAEDNGVLNEGR